MVVTSLTLHILLALAESEAGAAEIYHQIAKDSQSTFLPQERGLYLTLTRLSREGLVAETKRYGRNWYELTPRGRKVLFGEKMYLERVVTLLRERF